MYRYDTIDKRLASERVAQFRDQVRRRLANELSEDEFRPLRLQNGLYLQRHAYMLRVAIPYGSLSSTQLRMLGKIAGKYDRGYGHFTTRQNIQYNWLKLEDAPEILAELAAVDMSAIQASGNCVRTVTSDAFAGVAADEIVDPRPIAELLRQWSMLHPEFASLPRKFKIAVDGAREDRVIAAVHDVGVHLSLDANGKVVAAVSVGGGLGRTPMLGVVIRENLPWRHLTTYLSAILRVYNRFGRRDNLYKARIKFLAQALGPAEFTRRADTEWSHWRDGTDTLTQTEWDRVAAHFAPPAYLKIEELSNQELLAIVPESERTAFARWLERNVRAHRVAGYASVILSLKPHSATAPGDASSGQMLAVADLADRYSFGEIRVTHEQNLVLADVAKPDLYALWLAARQQGLATPNIGLLTDIISCPGGDYCSLSNTRSIPIALAIQKRFDDLDYLHDLGEISLNISGCMNSCGHHHLGNIGILGVDKDGEEWYQLVLGGEEGNSTAIGKIIGPSLRAADMPDVIAKLLEVYVEQRHADERFVDTLRRLGIEPFKQRVYQGA